MFDWFYTLLTPLEYAVAAIMAAVEPLPEVPVT